MKKFLLIFLLLFPISALSSEVRYSYKCTLNSGDLVCKAYGDKQSTVNVKSIVAMDIFAKLFKKKGIYKMTVVFDDGWWFSIMKKDIIVCMLSNDKGQDIANCVKLKMKGGKVS